MNLVCYLFDARAAADFAAQIARVDERLPLARICVVYRDGLSIDLFARDLRKLGVAQSHEYHPYAGADWEFGAYQLGIDAVVRAGDDLIIMNDTAGRHYPLFRADLARFARQVAVAKASPNPTIVGKVESVDHEFCLCDLEFNSWVRSNFFYLNSAAIGVLDRRVFDPSVFRAPLVDGDAFSIGLPASESLRRYLADWISPDPAKGGWLAHSGRRGVSDALRRDKTGSILLEKLLSARVVACGGNLLSYAPDDGAVLYSARTRVFFVIRRWRQKICDRVQSMVQHLRIAGS